MLVGLIGLPQMGQTTGDNHVLPPETKLKNSKTIFKKLCIIFLIELIK